MLFVKGNAEDGVLPDDKVKEIAAWLKTADINPAVKIAFRGANEELEDSIAFLGVLAFLMALFLMLILMVMQFNSFSSGIPDSVGRCDVHGRCIARSVGNATAAERPDVGYRHRGARRYRGEQ